MAQIALAPKVSDDIERILAHLIRYEVDDASARIQEIILAINVLEHSPFMGRPTEDGKRELIIGRGSRGYVALYRYIAEIDTVFILALRSQREAGYK